MEFIFVATSQGVVQAGARLKKGDVVFRFTKDQYQEVLGTLQVCYQALKPELRERFLKESGQILTAMARHSPEFAFLLTGTDGEVN